VFGLPIVLDTADESIQPGDVLKLTYQGADLAVMTVTEKYKPNKPLEAKMCYGTSSLEHPGVQMISMERGKYYLGACSPPLFPPLCLHTLLTGALTCRREEPCFLPLPSSPSIWDELG
jgi:hypothetical protein